MSWYQRATCDTAQGSQLTQMIDDANNNNKTFRVLFVFSKIIEGASKGINFE